MKRELLTFVLCLSAAFSTGCVQSEDVVRSREPSEVQQNQDEKLSDVRKLADKLQTETLPQLHLKGKTGREAMDILNQLGFQCALIAERKDTLWPVIVHQPFVSCIHFVSTTRRIYEQMLVGIFLEGWKGDGTPLVVRYDQLASAKVFDNPNVTRLLVDDQRDLSASKRESRNLDQSIVLATPDQPMAAVVKYVLTNAIACKTTVDELDHRNFLDCVAREITSGCVLASIRIEVTEGIEPSAPFSLWDTDRKVIGKQGPWTCHRPTRKR